MNAAETLKQTSAAVDQRAYEPSMEEILASIRRIIADDQSLPNRAFVRDGEATLRAALDNPETPAFQETVSLAAPESVERRGMPTTDAEAPEPMAVADEERAQPEPVAQTPRLVSAASLGHIAAPQYAMPDSPPPATNARRDEEREPSGFMPTPPSPAVVSPPARLEETARPETRRPPIAQDQAFTNKAPVASPPAPAASRSGFSQHGSETTSPEPETDAMSSLFSTATDQTVTAAFNTLAASRLVENDDALKDMVHDMIRPLLKNWLDDNLPNLVERLVRAEIERVGRGGR